MVNSTALKKRAKELGVRQKEIAERLGLKQSTINLKLNNKRPLLLEEAGVIAEVLCIRDDQFKDYFFV